MVIKGGFVPNVVGSRGSSGIRVHCRAIKKDRIRVVVVVLSFSFFFFFSGVGLGNGWFFWGRVDF